MVPYPPVPCPSIPVPLSPCPPVPLSPCPPCPPVPLSPCPPVPCPLSPVPIPLPVPCPVPRPLFSCHCSPCPCHCLHLLPSGGVLKSAGVTASVSCPIALIKLQFVGLVGSSPSLHEQERRYATFSLKENTFRRRPGRFKAVRGCNSAVYFIAAPCNVRFIEIGDEDYLSAIARGKAHALSTCCSPTPCMKRYCHGIV